VKTGAGMTRSREMSILDRIIGKKEEKVQEAEKKSPEIKAEKKETEVKDGEKKLVEKKEKTIKAKKSKKEVAKRKVSKREENIAHKILLENLISEKSTMLAAQNKYVFKVTKDAGKFQIKEAVEGYYGVQVVSVNTIKINPKKRIHGRTIGWKKGFKKAVVTLREGDSIAAVEGV
jgi:large subunit ribosomal protein L23